MRTKYFILIAVTVLAVAGGVHSQIRIPPEKPALNNNENIRAKNVAVQKALAAGNAAFSKKEFDTAITIYDAAVNADPEHPGVPTLLANKTYAEISRGRELFNAGLANKDAAVRDSGKAYLRAAAETSAKAVSLARSLDYQGSRLYAVLVARKEALQVYATRVEPKATIDALLAYRDYFVLERDPQKAVAGHIELGTLLVANGSPEAGKEEFEFVLEYLPKNPPALFGLGEALFRLGQEKGNDKDLFKKSAKAFKSFLAAASAGDPQIKNANDHLAFLKANYNITPK